MLKFERRPKEVINYPGMEALVDHVNSLPLSAERVQFSKSATHHDSSSEETPWEKGKCADAGGRRERDRRVESAWKEVRTVVVSRIVTACHSRRCDGCKTVYSG